MPRAARLLIPLAVVAVVALLAGRALLGTPGSAPSPVRPAPPIGRSAVPGTAAAAVAGSPVPVAAPSAGERAYAAELRARLAASDETARELVRLGEEKSRNLLAIRAAQGRMRAAFDRTDAFLRDNPPPPAAAPAVAVYQEGAAAVRTAMDEAWAGFTRFDWARVRRATERLRAGEAALARAVTELDGLAGGTPATGT